jgi:hypothetical protein
MTIDLNLTDGNLHQVAVYCLDFDSTGTRAERIDVLDAATDAILDTRTIAAFQNGQYLVWNLKGHVKLKTTLTGGANTVISGLFFGTPSGVSSPVLSVTKSHTGVFTQGQAGAAYSVTVNNGAAAGPTSGTVTLSESMPAGLTLVSMNGTGWNCASSTCTRSDVLVGGASYPPITVTVNVAANAAASVTNQVSVSGGGSATSTAADPTVVSAGGGSTTTTATFLRTDSTTQGTWKGTYGADGGAINGDTTILPSYAQVSFSGNNPFVWTSSTSDVRGLQKFVATDRIASGWYTFSNMTMDINLTDGNQHQVALYCLDWDTAGTRAERIDVLDAVTNAVLDTRTISAFQGGQYVVWNLKGHVKLKITLSGGANAVVSGLFF